MYIYVQCRVFYRYLKLCFTIDSYYNRCTCTSLYNVLLMCFQDADLWSKKKLLLSGTCLLAGHFYGQFSIIVSTTHSYIFAVFWHFISELCILERADVKGKTPCLTLSWYINVVLHVNVDLSFLFSFRTSGPYQTSDVRNYTSHVSHSRVGQGCAWREMESISCIKYNKQNSVTTRQWNKEIDQIIAVVLNYKIHCT